MSSDPKTRDTGGPAPAFEYPPPLSSLDESKPAAAGGTGTTLERLWPPDSGAVSRNNSAASEEETHARELRARNEGRAEGLAKAASDYETKLASQKQFLVEAVQEFTRERTTYFQRVEQEVVGLALAIARKILHRESQVDPLLLAGVVRVGLDKVASGTRLHLRVHPKQIAAWREFFSKQNDLRSLPELIEDASLGPAQCVLQTELGSTDLSLESQLREIEQGFFDQLAQKPLKPV